MRFIRIFLLVLSWPLFAQENPVAKKYGEMISSDHLKENLSIIASDAMEGRATGTRGQKMAAAFIKASFESYGLTGPVNGDYDQPVKLYSIVNGNSYLALGKNQYSNFEYIVYFGNSNTEELTSSVVLIASGKEEDVENADVAGKAVLLLTNTSRISTNPAVILARKKGAKLVLVCNSQTHEDFASTAKQFKSFFNARISLEKPELSTESHGIFIISPVVVKDLTGKTVAQLSQEAINGKTKAARLSINYRAMTEVKTVLSENVLGYLEGTDKKEELLIVTAHYDHIGLSTSGEDRINNGADDDGSGTVTVLELAKTFAQAKADGAGPRRSILFMAVTGEEEGLLGSDYYTRHPVFPLSSTVVNLNIDMIGRTDNEHEGKPDYVYVIGSDKLSKELHALSERVNQTYTKLDFDYLYNDENHPTSLYKRSDHWNFAKNNVPIIFYFDGIHKDYHRPSDEVDKIQFDLLTKRAKLVFYTAWEIANRDGRIVPDAD